MKPETALKRISGLLETEWYLLLERKADDGKRFTQEEAEEMEDVLFQVRNVVRKV